MQDIIVGETRYLYKIFKSVRVLMFKQLDMRCFDQNNNYTIYLILYTYEIQLKGRCNTS